MKPLPLTVLLVLDAVLLALYLATLLGPVLR